MMEFRGIWTREEYQLLKMRQPRLAILLLMAPLFLSVAAVSFSSLYDRELKSSYGFEILKYYHDEQFGDEDVKHFQGESVLFMTPWRKGGIQLSIKYMKKFDYFIPCFYDIKKVMQPSPHIELKTSAQYSEEYLQRAKEANPDIKIIPRVYVDGMQGDVFFLVSTEEEQEAQLMKFFAEILENPLYDGVAFMTPFMTPNHKYPFSMKNILKKIREIADSNGKLIFIGLEGVDDKPDRKVNKKKARELIDLSDRVIVANYDYPRGNSGVTIPISPMKWIKENYEFYCEVYSKAKITPKLIMAIPLYGYFVGLYGKYDPIQGNEFIEKIKSEKQAYLSWNQEIEECMIYLNKMEFLYFPCLHFLNSRLRYFESINVGVGAFEIGGGLEIFMQMF